MIKKTITPPSAGWVGAIVGLIITIVSIIYNIYIF